MPAIDHPMTLTDRIAASTGDRDLLAVAASLIDKNPTAAEEYLRLAEEGYPYSEYAHTILPPKEPNP